MFDLVARNTLSPRLGKPFPRFGGALVPRSESGACALRRALARKEVLEAHRGDVVGVVDLAYRLPRLLKSPKGGGVTPLIGMGDKDP